MNLLRIGLSVVLSTILWLAFPFLLLISDTSRTSYGWSVLWNEMPQILLGHVAPFFVVSIVMHVLFSRAATKVKGWKFWILPFPTLLFASLLYWLISGITSGFSYLPYLLAVVMIGALCFSYPLAIANQIIIRKLVKCKCA